MLVNGNGVIYDPKRSGETQMGLAATEEELRDRTARFVKAELKRANVTYGELAERLEQHGIFGETENSIKAKLKRGTFPATFLFATLAAIKRDTVSLSEL